MVMTYLQDDKGFATLGGGGDPWPLPTGGPPPSEGWFGGGGNPFPPPPYPPPF